MGAEAGAQPSVGAEMHRGEPHRRLVHHADEIAAHGVLQSRIGRVAFAEGDAGYDTEKRIRDRARRGRARSVGEERELAKYVAGEFAVDKRPTRSFADKDLNLPLDDEEERMALLALLEQRATAQVAAEHGALQQERALAFFEHHVATPCAMNGTTCGSRASTIPSRPSTNHRRAEAIVSGRCAIMTRVSPRSFTAAVTRRSMAMSRCDVPSSMNRIFGRL